MEIKKRNKTLYHVQSTSNWQDEPYDIFVYAKSASEVRENLAKLYQDDYGDIDKDSLEDLIDTTNIYTVYAVEL